VNDRFGHTAGDAVLQIAATRLLHVVRSADDVFRLGGDEFAILQAGTGSADEALSLASRIIASFREPIEAGASRHLVGSSVGIAMLPAHGTNAVELVEAADAALYRAKQSGRGRYVVAVAAEPTVLTRAGRAVV
jgi:diguanylate cyclase (GGDEF)-like protein